MPEYSQATRTFIRLENRYLNNSFINELLVKLIMYEGKVNNEIKTTSQGEL